jgi:ATP-dependent RNA helicase HelY
VFAGLDAPAIAAVASTFTYETRIKDAPEPRVPTMEVGRAIDAVLDLWADIAAREENASLPQTRAPDPGFAEALWRWASGADLDDALRDSLMTAGDFVRSTKQAADVLEQIAEVSPGTDVARRAREARKAIVRGVVAYSGV